MTPKLIYLAMLFLVSFQSCSMCSFNKMDTSVLSEDSETIVECENKKP